MPRMKTTARVSPGKALVLKKIAKAKAIIKDQNGLIHTGKLKVPFRPAAVAHAKKGLLKQLKRRWKSGTVAKREIRKLSRSTHLLFPKRPFNRLVREIAQDIRSDMRFTGAGMQAIQEAAEIFVTEMFHKADMARKHAKRHTLHVEDVRFSRFMTQDSLWVMPERIWDKETFAAAREVPKSGSKKVKTSIKAGDMEGTAAASSKKKDGDKSVSKTSIEKDKSDKAAADPTTPTESGSTTKSDDGKALPAKEGHEQPQDGGNNKHRKKRLAQQQQQLGDAPPSKKSKSATSSLPGGSKARDSSNVGEKGAGVVNGGEEDDQEVGGNAEEGKDDEGSSNDE